MSALWPLLLKYLIGLAGISVVVLIHETGHLVMASLMGIGEIGRASCRERV